MADIVTVRNEKITRLQYEAQGFRNTFFILYNSMMNGKDCEKWWHDGDKMSVLGTNGCFALELYLKFLTVEASFNSENLSGTHLKIHKLDELYDELTRVNYDYIQDLENNYSNIKYKGRWLTLKDFLSSIGDYFVDWRYAYDKGMLNINLNTLSSVLNFMEEYSMGKFRPIADILAKNQPLTSDNQTMSISNFDDIQKQ